MLLLVMKYTFKELMLKMKDYLHKGPFVTECIAELSKIYAVLFVPEENESLEKIIKANKGIGKYKYFKNMSVGESVVIFADSPAGKILIYLEPNEDMYNYLRAVATYNSGK